VAQAGSSFPSSVAAPMDLQDSKAIVLSPEALERGDRECRLDKWQGPVPKSQVYFAYIGIVKGSGAYLHGAVKGTLCSTTKHEKPFLRVSIPTATYEALTSVVPGGARLSKPPSVRDEDNVDLVVLKNKWKVHTQAGIEGVTIKTANGTTDVVSIYDVMTVAAHTTPVKHLSLTLTFRVSLSCKSPTVIDSTDALLASGLPVGFSFSVVGASLDGRVDFPLYEQSSEGGLGSRVQVQSTVCSDDNLVAYLRRTGSMSQPAAEDTSSSAQ